MTVSPTARHELAAAARAKVRRCSSLAALILKVACSPFFCSMATARRQWWKWHCIRWGRWGAGVTVAIRSAVPSQPRCAGRRCGAGPPARGWPASIRSSGRGHRSIGAAGPSPQKHMFTAHRMDPAAGRPTLPPRSRPPRRQHLTSTHAGGSVRQALAYFEDFRQKARFKALQKLDRTRRSLPIASHASQVRPPTRAQPLARAPASRPAARAPVSRPCSPIAGGRSSRRSGQTRSGPPLPPPPARCDTRTRTHTHTPSEQFAVGAEECSANRLRCINHVLAA